MSFDSITVGFDGKRAAQNRTGLGNYSRFVISGLSKFSDIGRLLVYAPNEKRMECIGGLDKMPKVEMRFPQTTWHRALRSLWRVHGMTDSFAKDGVTLFHGLSGELTVNIRKAKDVRSIVTIHDLIFRHCPENYGRIDRLIYDYKFRSACENADKIIAVSECTKRDVVKLYGVDPQKVVVTYQGCDESFWHEATEEEKSAARNTLNLPQRYILYVGTVERRKNLMLLAKALTHLPKDVCVVAIGKRTAYAGEVEHFCAANGLSDRLRICSGVSFKLFPAVYQMADAVVYPSRFEGFGIPLLEAIVSGIPAIGCTGSCLEEAGGPGSIYVNPDDDEGLAASIDKVLTDSELRKTMIDMGRDYAMNFRQDKLTEKLLEVYADVLAAH